MAQAEGVGSVIVGAVLDAAKRERSAYVHKSQDADLHSRQARASKDEADAARERWEKCIDWLEANVPGWESGISEAELKEVRG